MDEYSPDARPFSAAMKTARIPESLRTAFVEIELVMDLSKRMLLEQKVRNFSSDSVVELARLVLDRENEITLRTGKQ